MEGQRRFLSFLVQNPTFLEPGKPGGNQIRLEVPLIHIPPKETLVGAERDAPLMDVDSEVVPATVTVDGDVANPTSTDGRDLDLPSSLQSVVSPMLSPGGPSELPRVKKRRVMFADE